MDDGEKECTLFTRQPPWSCDWKQTYLTHVPAGLTDDGTLAHPIISSIAVTLAVH